MKRCPTCKRTFEDSLTYCLIDGSVLSAPFEEAEEEVDLLATEVLPENARTPTPTERMAPPQATMAAAFEPVHARQTIPESSATEATPVGLIACIGLVTVFYLGAILMLLVVKWESVSSYFGWALVRRTPIFAIALIGILVALVRMKHHLRVSLLTILALIIYAFQGMFFYLFTTVLIDFMAKMRLSPSVGEWVYFFVYFFEDFVFVMVIVLLVSAAYKGRNKSYELTPERS